MEHINSSSSCNNHILNNSPELITNKQDHQKLIETKNEILFSNSIIMNLGKKNEFTKIYLRSDDSNRKVDQTSQVLFYIQKYIFANEKFVIINSDYKNPIKKKIPDMTKSDSLLREMLLGLKRDEEVLFFFNRANDDCLYKDLIKKSKLPEQTNFDNIIYYKIILKEITFQKPVVPSKINELSSFFNTILDLTRYYIKSQNYTEAISLSNFGIKNMFEMKKELKQNLKSEINKELKIIVKNIISNKTLCQIKKLNESEYDQIIEVIKNEYVKNYQNQNDLIDKKIMYRMAFCLEKKKSYNDCHTILLELDKKYPNDKDIIDLLNIVKEFKKLPNNNGNFKKGFFKNVTFNEDPGYHWEEESNDLCFDYNIEESEEILQKNLAEFN